MTKLKPLLRIFALLCIALIFFIFLLSNVYAYLNGTYAPNGTMSLNPSDYQGKFICGGCFDNGTVCQPLTSSNVTVLGDVSRSDCEINMTLGAPAVGFIFGGESNRIGEGWACEFQMLTNMTTATNLNSFIGADLDMDFNDDSNPAYGLIGGVNGNRPVLYFATNDWVATTNFNRPVEQWWNVSINFTSTTSHKVWVNNSDDLAVQSSATFTFPYNFSGAGSVGSGAGKMGVRRIFCFNSTEGAPQEEQILPDTCTAPGSGDWNIDCTDNCNLDAAQDVPADMHLNGIGTIRLSAPLTFTGTDSFLSIGSQCTLSIESGGQIG